MGRKGVECHEPSFVSLLEGFPKFNACKKRFEGIWYQFFQKFQGYDDEITLKFAQGFDGKIVHIGDFIMAILEKTFAHATGLPRQGEHWFKNKPIESKMCTRFLKEEHQSANWKKVFPRDWMEGEWRNVLYVLQKYLTYEGRYVTTLNYHIHLLLHFEVELEMNFPYFLYKSLAKMLGRVQKHSSNPYNSLYHYVLVKILIEDELHI